MRNYTPRLVTAPVQRDAWDAHYGFLDAVPGASLLENPAAPEIVLDLDAHNPATANRLALNLTDRLDLDVTRVSVTAERIL
ncbi:hypothetical protein V5S96_03855 [Corynebacterium mastitidis]|uniref:Uncharacterized protein n=1 Tax=Corynebacterium mastitidis TaxID=161890 RepID=A0ABU8NWX1_9CORY